MTVGFNPSVSNNKQQNFCAILPKYYESAQKAVQNRTGYIDATGDLYEAFVAKDVSHQDTIDTLDAMKKIFPENFKKLIDSTKEDIAYHLKK